MTTIILFNPVYWLYFSSSYIFIFHNQSLKTEWRIRMMAVTVILSVKDQAFSGLLSSRSSLWSTRLTVSDFSQYNKLIWICITLASWVRSVCSGWTLPQVKGALGHRWEINTEKWISRICFVFFCYFFLCLIETVCSPAFTHFLHCTLCSKSENHTSVVC